MGGYPSLKVCPKVCVTGLNGRRRDPPARRDPWRDADELLKELLAEYKKPQDLLGPNWLYKQLMGARSRLGCPSEATRPGYTELRTGPDRELVLDTQVRAGRTVHIRPEAKEKLFDYIEVFYNQQRRHSSLDYVSPAEYEKAARESRATA